MIIILGLLLSITVGAFFGLIFTAVFENIVVRCIVTVVLALAIGFGLVGAMEYEHKISANNWNNGYCQKCGNELELFDVEYIKYGGNIYYYKCDNQHIVKTSQLFEKD